jgi:hypothetical protein
MTIGVDIDAGRTFFDLPFSTIERGARKLGP